MLVKRCVPPEYVYIIIALSAEIQWHVVGGPSKMINDWQDSRAITAIRVGGWHFPALQAPAPNVHHGDPRQTLK